MEESFCFPSLHMCGFVFLSYSLRDYTLSGSLCRILFLRSDSLCSRSLGLGAYFRVSRNGKNQCDPKYNPYFNTYNVRSHGSACSHCFEILSCS